jgi:hypothetical protein
MDLLSSFFDAEGNLVSRPRRHGKEMTARDAIGLAMLYAYVRGQQQAVDFLLEKDGNWNMTGVNDVAMRHIGAVPRLRMLMGQGTVAGDDGFAALSRSQTIEYIWGRECPNLEGRGFAAMAAMPALRGLAVSCKNVGDEALSTLPRFPALRELMPMDVPDAGFRHVGRCENLEALWCMYCRDTTDAATEHIAGLSRLKTYYAGKTRITDRSLEILGRTSSLESLEFWECAGLTDAGIAHLAALPHLRKISLGGSPRVTRRGMAVFPAFVQVDYS